MELFDLDPAPVEHVYPVREDSLLLASQAVVHAGELVLEVGCGRGLAALSAARAGASVLASDLNLFALRSVQREGRGLTISEVLTDLFGGLGRFDVVLFNPPYLPSTPAREVEDAWERLALDGGPRGTELSQRWLEELPSHLTASGRGYLLRLEALEGRPQAPLHVPQGLVARRVGDPHRLEGETLSVWELRRASGGTAATRTF